MNLENKVVPSGKVQSFSIEQELLVMRNRMTVHNRAESSIRNYCRSLRNLNFFFKINPRELEIDQVLQRIRKALEIRFVPEKVKLSLREIIIKTTGVDPYKCAKCKKGMMVVIKIMPGARGSPNRFFASDKPIKLVL